MADLAPTHSTALSGKSFPMPTWRSSRGGDKADLDNDDAGCAINETDVEEEILIKGEGGGDPVDGFLSLLFRNEFVRAGTVNSALRSSTALTK